MRELPVQQRTQLVNAVRGLREVIARAADAQALPEPAVWIPAAIWASGRVPHHQGWTHDRNRT